MRRYGVVGLTLVVFVLALLWGRTGDISEPSRREALAARPASPVVAPPAVLAIAPSQVAATGLRVEGTVVDAQQGTPIVNATLEFESEAGDREVVTDANGRFSFAGAELTWVLTAVRFRGFQTLNPDLAFDRSTSDVKLQLTRLPLRRGRVVDTSGRPIEGALLQPYLAVDFAGRELESVVSDPRGEFQLLLDDSARVTVSHACCISTNVPVGRPEDELVITLQPANFERVTFRGQVVDEDDVSIEGARVTGLAHTDKFEVTQSLSVTSGIDGRFQVQVPAGATIILSAQLGDRDSDELTVRAQDEAKLTVLERASAFSGRVTNEAGQPVTRFTVSLSGLDVMTREFTSADGRFTYDGLPKIRGTVTTVGASGYLDSEPELLRLARGEQATGLEFVLHRGRTISGVVFDRDTRHPLAGANVRLTAFRLLSGPNGHTRTDSLGRFVMGGLKEGRVEFLVSRSGYVSRQEVLDTSNQAEVRIGLASSSSSNAKEEYAGVGMRFGNTDVDAGSGYFVSALHPQGGAHVAGVLVGDEILSANGVPAGSVETTDFLLQIKGAEGTMVRLTVRRDGNTFDVHAVRRVLSSW